MAFERFTLAGRGFQPKVSIRTNGQIGFNNGAIIRFNLDKYKYVILFYDKQSKMIGIKPTNDANEEGICKLRIRKSAGAIGARSFLDYYQINHAKTIRYGASWNDGEKMVVAKVE